MSRFDPINIGEAALRLGVSTAALRLYERKGLLPKTTRTTGGYRQYSQEDLRTARLIRRARRAGLSMRQIAQAIAVPNDQAAMRDILRMHVDHLEREGRRLARLQRHLCRWLADKHK